MFFIDEYILVGIFSRLVFVIELFEKKKKSANQICMEFVRGNQLTISGGARCSGLDIMCINLFTQSKIEEIFVPIFNNANTRVEAYCFYFCDCGYVSVMTFPKPYWKINCPKKFPLER